MLIASCGGGVGVLDTELEGRTPVVIDADFGGDDMMALLYLLQDDSVSVRAVTITGTGLAHCPAGAANARAVLDHVGFEDVPVACGPAEPIAGTNAFPDQWRQGADGLATQVGLEAPEVAEESEAVDLLVETVKQSPVPVRLLALGPLTNVALAMDQAPWLVDNLQDIVMMGGAVDVNGTVETAMTAEWNVWVDPVAANRVMRSGVPITLVPLDATNDVPASVFFFEALAEQKATPEAELVYRFFKSNPFNLEGGAYFFWDPLAAVAAVDSSVVTFDTRRIAVVEAAGEQHGATVESANGAEVTLATAADRQLFETEFLTMLNGGSPAVVEVPVPDLSITYETDGTCALVGPGEVTTGVGVVVEVINESEGTVAVVFGLHEGIGIEQIREDAAAAAETDEVPDYWVETGALPVFAASLTGGSVIGRVDLVGGTHAMVCADEANNVTVLGDLVVTTTGG